MVDNFPLGRFVTTFSLQDAAEALIGECEGDLRERINTSNADKYDRKKLAHITELKQALYQSLIDGALVTVWQEINPDDPSLATKPIFGVVPYEEFLVSRSALINWAHSRGLTCPFYEDGEERLHEVSTPSELTNPNSSLYCSTLHAAKLVEDAVKDCPIYKIAPNLVIERCIEQLDPNASKRRIDAIKLLFNHRTTGAPYKNEQVEIISHALKTKSYFPDDVRVRLNEKKRS